MRLFILTFLALLAFAANSILNRWALLDGATGPMTFAFVRVLSVAIFLWLIVAVNDHKWRPKFHIFPSVSLSIYIICFSIAYLNLGIGIGAVVLFGAVQFTMFGLAALTSEEISELKDQGKVDRTCYGGGKAKGDKPCISHRPHEAQIYGATYIQQAYLMKDQFTKEQFQIIDKYIDTLYKKYIGPWTLSELGGPRGFIQMADGTISVLSYLAWKDKPEEVAKWIKKGIGKADRVVYDDGYIHNNSFRGVRDVWYHSQGVNNLLGLYAIAELWGYKRFPAELKQRIDKTVDVLNLGLTDVKKYRERKDPSGLQNFTKDQKHATHHVHQMAISLDWLIDKYTDKDHTIVANDRMWKSKKSVYFVDRNFGFEPKCMN